MMKKVICLIMAVLLVVPAVAFAESDVTSEGMQFFKAYEQTDADTIYKEITSFESGNVCAGTTVKNNASEAKNVKVFFATYSDASKTELESVKVQTVTVAAGEEAELKTEALKLDNNNNVKAFLWTDKITPIVSSSAPISKTERIVVDFEDECYVTDSAPPANNSLPSRLGSSNVVIAEDPEENGTRGKVLKLDASKKGYVQFNGFLNNNLGVADLADYYSASIEFDIFFPTGLLQTIYLNVHPVDGGGTMLRRFSLADSKWPSVPGKFGCYYNNGSSYVLDTATEFVQSEFYGSWHTVKVEFMPASDNSIAETAIYLDGQEVSRVIGKYKNSITRPNRFTISSESVTQEGGYSYYVDNVKISA